MDKLAEPYTYLCKLTWIYHAFFLVVLFGDSEAQITRYTDGVPYSCGGLIQMRSASANGTISTPDYPARYPNLARCIWLFEAPEEYTVSLEISGMLGESTGTGCVDFLEIRNGSSTSSLMYYECSSSTATTILGYSRWLWVKFESDWTNRNYGFTAKYSLTPDPGNSQDESPVPSCINLFYECANKQCVSWSYRCDGDNDCGCSESGCDEIDCGGLDWPESLKVAVGIGVGVAVFIFVFIGVGLLEICLKKRAERKYQQQLEEAKRRAKLKKAQNMAKNFLMNAADSAKLNVPSIDLNASMSSTTSSVKS